MGRKKNPDNKPREQEIREKLEASRQIQTPMDSGSDKKIRHDFSLWWASNRKAYNRPKDLESVLWAHLKSVGHDKPELFQKGIEHFGLKK